MQASTKSYTFLFTTDDTNGSVKAGLDVALVAAALGQSIQLIFTQDAVSLLATPTLADEQLGRLKLCDPKSIYLSETYIQAQSIRQDQLWIQGTLISEISIKAKLRNSQILLSY